MYRTGVASLPLHGGKAPAWLTSRMRNLAKEIAAIIIDEYGTDTLLSRLSDPYWFQAFGCVLGYDWHSSGVTTVVTGILKTALTPQEHGIAVCGGKGKTSKKTPAEILENCQKFNYSTDFTDDLIYTSRMTAKVDTAAIQAGYQLYHHAFFITENKKWAVIQQGMSAQDKTARRYHWLSDIATSLIVEPHNAVVGDAKRATALNMTAKQSENARNISVDLSKEKPEKILHLIKTTLQTLPQQNQHENQNPKQNQQSLQQWLPKLELPQMQPPHQMVEELTMPRNISWETLKRVYEFQPRNYEELLSVKGVGPATIRGLALVAEIVYGEKPSWVDPVKYSFAYGGKDGVPYPVNRQAMDESIALLKQAVQAAKVGDKQKTRALQGLRRFVPLDAKNS